MTEADGEVSKKTGTQPKVWKEVHCLTTAAALAWGAGEA